MQRVLVSIFFHVHSLLFLSKIAGWAMSSLLIEWNQIYKPYVCFIFGFCVVSFSNLMCVLSLACIYHSIHYSVFAYISTMAYLLWMNQNEEDTSCYYTHIQITKMQIVELRDANDSIASMVQINIVSKSNEIKKRGTCLF